MSDRARTVLGWIGVVALVCGSALLAAVGVDVLRTDRELQRADLAFTTGVARDASWRPDTLLPAGIATGALGLDDDLAYRRAAQRFWAAEPRAPLRQFSDVTRRAAVEREIARLADTDASRERRSRLETMRGALLLEEARNSLTQRQVFVRRAIGHFQRAVALDPTNRDAIHDLELSLKLLRRSGSGPDSGGDARSPKPSPGAGASTSGSGL